jgi:quinol monooxygenase YgiN
MIIRIVKLRIREEYIENFRQLTNNERNDILNFPGCHHLEVKQEVNEPTLFFTISHWDDEKALNHYRESDFFRGNWSTVKQWFDAKPEAWSLQ